ncbi:phosphotransferase [Leekyejoonella antrihumi]|uniref:phosphotransferase n=1 Tax=Leekyejoonella antrihumi TaxID=1660198 RepID=UPI003CCC5355
MLEQWRTALGAFDAYAIYQRRQTSRDGLTLLLTQHGRPVAVVKVRGDGRTLETEQRALEAATAAGRRYFQVPQPLGMAWLHHGGAWSAQAAVFDAPHRPVFDAPSALFDEIRDALQPVVSTTGTAVPAHNDMTPWNLRRDRRGQIWLFDWEDVGPAPVGFDRSHFWATSYATRQCTMPDDLPRSGVAYCREIATARRDDPTTDPADAATARRMLAGLDRAPNTRPSESVAGDQT